VNRLLSSLEPLLACPVCWGTDGKSMDDANAAVVLMLAVLLAVFAAFGCFILSLAWRARRIAREDAAAGLAAHANSVPAAR
jgi:hypothetical protein